MAKELYDVAIIGSGIGGLSAAARLARKGYKVLVTERFRLLGGRCSTLNLNGYLVSTGAIGIEKSGPLEQTFIDVGAAFPVKRPDPQLAYFVDGKSHVMPPKGGLRWLLHQVAEDERDAERVMAAMKRALTWDEPSMSITFKDWLSQYTSDLNIHGAMQGAIVTTQVINAWEIPAGAFIQFVKNGGYRDFGLCQGGNISMIENLANVVRSNGGTIWTGATVKRIIIDRWTATGMVVDRPDGELEVGARVVISSAGPRKTLELAGRENFERGYVKDVDFNIRPAPVVALFVVSDRPLIEHPGAFIPVNTRRVYLMFQATLTCPELAPKGMHYLESFSAFADSLGPVNLDEEIALNIADTRDIIGHEKFDKYGRILAAECFYGDWPAGHTWPGYDVGQKTSIENLYNVGDGVKLQGWSSGTPAAAETARVVVEDIVNRHKPGAG
ncbi:MAG: FAD-dependent oxidoreductase [Dehalococcoidia bacterium]|nr:FAD-dependent oxidoreductase [Dehalococcoidia bacterium]